MNTLFRFLAIQSIKEGFGWEYRIEASHLIACFKVIRICRLRIFRMYWFCVHEFLRGRKRHFMQKMWNRFVYEFES